MSNTTPRRKPLSKTVRFSVLERDNFTCQYCGATPQNGALEVDHIIPVADGGCDDPSNLITSCEPCNKGKGRKRPKAAPLPDMASLAREAEERAESIRRWIEANGNEADAVSEAVAELRRRNEGFTIPSHVIASYIREYGISEVDYAAAVTAGRVSRTDPKAQTAYARAVLRKRRDQGESCTLQLTETCSSASCSACEHAQELSRDAISRALKSIKGGLGANPISKSQATVLTTALLGNAKESLESGDFASVIATLAGMSAQHLAWRRVAQQLDSGAVSDAK